MTPALESQILISLTTLAAAFLGFLLAGWNEARRDRRTAERERATRAEDRRSAAIRDRHQFQLETLLELQDTVQLMARLTGRAMVFDHLQARKGLYTQFPEPYSEEMHSNGVDLIRLRNRLLDDDLRDALERFADRCVEVTMSPRRYEGLEGDALETAAFSLSGEFGSDVAEIMDKLGVALRNELAWTPDKP